MPKKHRGTKALPQPGFWPKDFDKLGGALGGYLAAVALLFVREPIATIIAEVLFLASSATFFYLLLREQRPSREQQIRRAIMLVGMAAITLFLTTLPWTFIKTDPPRARLRVKAIDVQMGIGAAASANLHLVNVGDATATAVLRADTLRFAERRKDEDSVFRGLHSELTKESGGLSIPAGGAVWFTVNGPVLQRDDFIPKDAPPGSSPQVARGVTALLVAAAIRYRDSDTAKQDQIVEACVFAMNPNVLILCEGHNVGR